MPAVVLAVTTAVSTVVATKITEGLVGSIVKAVRGWLSRREDDEAPVLRAPGTVETLVIDEHTTDEEIAEFIRNVRDEE